MYYYGSNIGVGNPFNQSSFYLGRRGNIPEHAQSVINKDSYEPSHYNNNKNKKAENKTNNWNIIGKIAIAAAALVAVYKGHNIISKGITRISNCKNAYKATHANLSLKGIGHAGKKVGGSILEVGKSVLKLPRTLAKETVGIFKKTS